MKDHFEYYGSTLDALCTGRPYRVVKKRIRVLQRAGIMDGDLRLIEPRVQEIYDKIARATGRSGDLGKGSHGS